MKAWHAAHRKISPLPELSEWTLMQVSISLENGLPPAEAALGGGHVSINDVCHLWILHYIMAGIGD